MRSFSTDEEYLANITENTENIEINEISSHSITYCKVN